MHARVFFCFFEKGAALRGSRTRCVTESEEMLFRRRVTDERFVGLCEIRTAKIFVMPFSIDRPSIRWNENFNE